MINAPISSINDCSVVDNSSLDIHLEPKYVGIIALLWDGSHGEFAWGHSSHNFVLAHQTSKMRSAKVSEIHTCSNIY